jgi:hypothetical protein
MPDRALPERIPVAEWTDDEWLAVMLKFPPDASNQIVEEWVAEQRKETDGQQS